MKQLLDILIPVILLNSIACRQPYEDGPSRSIYTPEARITGNWNVKSIKVNGEDKTYRADSLNLDFYSITYQKKAKGGGFCVPANRCIPGMFSIYVNGSYDRGLCWYFQDDNKTGINIIGGCGSAVNPNQNFSILGLPGFVATDSIFEGETWQIKKLSLKELILESVKNGITSVTEIEKIKELTVD